jgi:hypothetical protein
LIFAEREEFMQNPRLSALLSGTPKQVSALIPNAENGLFSRFIFYFMNIKPVWKDVFANSGDQSTAMIILPQCAVWG